MNVPLYQKISKDLKEEIITQKISVGDQLPTEKELSETYKVSRITAKRALTELEQQGLVTRTRGKGTFVKDATRTPTPAGKQHVLFIIPFEGMSFGDFTQGLQPTLQNVGITVFITYANYLREHSAATIRESFDGLIYYPMDTSDNLDILLELALHNFPVVLLDKKIYDLPFPCVTSDNFSGGEMAAQLLIAQKHEKIAFISSNEMHHPHTTRARYLGYIKALTDGKLPFHTALSDQLSSESSVLELVREQHVTAMVCENDLVALKTMSILQSNGFSVPNDISVIGFDNIQAAELSNPPLTTVAQDFTQIGFKAGEMLINWIDGQVKSSDIEIPVRLIERKSTLNENDISL